MQPPGDAERLLPRLDSRLMLAQALLIISSVGTRATAHASAFLPLRALELLASCSASGCTEAVMLAHGFTVEQTGRASACWTRSWRPEEKGDGSRGHGIAFTAAIHRGNDGAYEERGDYAMNAFTVWYL